jgi:hypothetical protein
MQYSEQAKTLLGSRLDTMKQSMSLHDVKI